MMTEQRWEVIPGAESSDAFTARIVGAVDRIAARHVDQFVVVFTHGAVIAQLLSHATGARRFSFISDNASLSHLIVHDGRWYVRRYNDTTHLHAGFTTAARADDLIRRSECGPPRELPQHARLHPLPARHRTDRRIRGQSARSRP